MKLILKHLGDSLGSRLSHLLTILCWLAAAAASPAAPGDADLDFNAGLDGHLFTAAVQLDGKIIIGGYFDYLDRFGPNEVRRPQMARLNPDGTPDPDFFPSPNAGADISALAVQEDGKILVGGIFTSFQPGGPDGGGPVFERNGLARLHPDGTVDETFNADGNLVDGQVTCIKPQPDGTILISGWFENVDGQPRRRLARLNADGTLDASFVCDIGGTPPSDPTVDAQGRIILAHYSLYMVNGVDRWNIARVSSTGVLDDFYPYMPWVGILTITIRPDGRILLGGGTTGDFSGHDIHNLILLDEDGTLDTSFRPNPDSMVYGMTLLTDGSLLLSGSFRSFPQGDPEPTQRWLSARLLPDNSVDPVFNPSAASNAVNFTLVEPDGSLLLVGVFSAINYDQISGGEPRAGIARVEGFPSSSELAATSAERVQWLREGGMAEPEFVHFDLSTDNGDTWTRLGRATRATGGWELTGLDLPTAGKLRARARFSYGAEHRTSSFVQEEVENYALPLLVRGSANVWLAGHPNGTTAANNDFAPGQSPVLAPITLVPGQDVIFDVTGGTHNGPIGPGTTGPDGGAVITHEAENGIAALKAPINAMVGVFLKGDPPPAGAPDPYEDFTDASARDYAVATPKLYQPFFIGDGRASDESVQRVRIPDNATRLFLGSLDVFDNAENYGEFAVNVTMIAPLPDVPQPANPNIVTGNPGEPWTFNVTHLTPPAGLRLRVQSSTTPGSWADLPGGGLMTEGLAGVWSLTLSQLPLGHRSFRVIQEADGHTTSRYVFPQTFDISSPAGRILYTRGFFGSTELVLMESDGSGKKVLTNNTFAPVRAALSPDGSRVAFTTLAGELFIMKAKPMHAATNVPVNVLEGADASVRLFAIPSWAPDGRHVVFADNASHIQVIEAVDAEGDPDPYDELANPLIDVYASFSGSPNVAWSPDGRYIALTDGPVIRAFPVMDAGGDITPAAPGEALTLTDINDTGTQKVAVSWSHDGTQIAFVEQSISTSKYRAAKVVVSNGSGTFTPENSSGNPRVPLGSFDDAAAPQTVSWSPDGSLLAMEVMENGERRIDVILPGPADPMANPPLSLTVPGAEGDAYQPSFQQPVVEGPQLVSFDADSYAGNEDDEEPISVRVVRTGSASGELTVAFSITGGTATPDADFTISESPLIFGNGETEKVIIVTPLPDAEDQEGDETVLLQLDPPGAGALGDITSATVTIADSDGSLDPFVPPANSLAVAVNGKTLKTGKGKSGDELKFTARQEQGWSLNGIQVKVQYTTTPKQSASWRDLPEPLLARASLSSLTWVAATKKFPVGKLYFRARTQAIGHRGNTGPVAGPFTIKAAPVLELTLDVDTDSDPSGLTVKPGEFIMYKIKCKNIGTAKAAKVTLNSRVPRYTRFDSASHASVPSYFKQILGSKGEIADVQWKVGDIQPGAEVNEFLTVQMNQADMVDYNVLIQNDRLTYRISKGKEVRSPIFGTTVSPPIKISIAKDKSIVQAGDLITYTITATNEASFVVTGGQVTDQIPLGTRLISTAHGNGSGNYLGIYVDADTLIAAPNGLLDPGLTPTANTPILTWKIGDVEPGGSRQMRFQVRVAYDLFEKLFRNGESFNIQIQNLNFDFTATPPGGGVIAAWGGVIAGDKIARTFVSAEPPAARPEMGLQKLALSDSWAKLGTSDIAAVFVDGRRQIGYELSVWNYGGATATRTQLFDGVPYETEITPDVYLAGDADTDIFTTDAPHHLSIGERVLLPYLEGGGSALSTSAIYHVRSVPSATQFTLAKTANGAAVDFKSHVTIGTLRRMVYDADAFMRKFSLDGIPLSSSAGFRFYDAKGSILSPGGEPFIDHNGNGKIDKYGPKTDVALFSGASEFLDQNGNGIYDGPGAIRSFTFDLGDLPPMTAPFARRLSYRVQLTPNVKSGEYIAGLSSAVHKQGQGLQLTCPDFFYPVIGSPPIEYAKVVKRLQFAMDRPRPRDIAFVAGPGGNLQVTYDLTFTNKGSFYAVDTKLRVPIPAGFTTPSVPALQKFNEAYDVALSGSPGTAVFGIGEVAPDETVTRQLVLNMTSPIPASLYSNGVLKNYAAPIYPKVYATQASNAPATAPAAPASAPKGTAKAFPFEGMTFTMKADGTSGITTPIQLNIQSTRVFIGRICDASILEGFEGFEIFIFFGNLGYGASGPGEVAMQVPYGTRYLGQEPLCFNPVGGTTSTTASFQKDYFEIKEIKGKRRPEDGPIDIVRWKFKNIPPSTVYCVKMKLAVNKPFPGTAIVDKSAYISVANAAARSSAPLIIKVRKDASGATDWWQGVGDLLEGIGIWLDDSMRNVMGDHVGRITVDSTTAVTGGADVVQLDNGSLVIPLGSGRSLLIAAQSQLFPNVPRESMMTHSTDNGLGMAAGATVNQQVFVRGSINGFQNVHTMLNQLTHPVNSIVAAGGGNIVAAGGGNIVAAGGGNIVAGGGGNAISNDDAGFATIGSLIFADPPSIVAAGGGNIVAAGGGNIIRADGGNIVAAGGGNMVEIGDRLIKPSEMSSIINTLVGMDGASFADAIVRSKLGAAISNDGAGVKLDPDTLHNQINPSLIGLDGASLTDLKP